MQSKFEFLNPQFPKLAGYGERAEEAINADNNICLFYLARIAETITEVLRRATNIEENLSLPNVVNELQEHEIIDADIARKINTLIENKQLADDEINRSESSCSYLMTAALELCEWFVLRHGESKFSFLAELFLPGRYVPPFANLAEIGREAEENLYTNTRYCLICLGDIGEAIVDYLMDVKSIETHERDQLYRINALFQNYVIDDEIKDSLHDLRMARNKAVHERYDNTYTSEDEAERLLAEVLKLCEWLFKYVLKPGYIVKGRVADVAEDDSLSVLIGEIPARVTPEEIPENENGEKKSCVKGRKYIFKVLEKNGDDISLSLRQADEDYDLNLAQKYSKYRIGQDVRVLIKRISNSSGALVEIEKDGLLAKIPPSEIGRRLYDYDKENQKQIKYEVIARVKWFSQTQFPPMLLSVRDIEEEEEKKGIKPDVEAIEQHKAMKDIDFRVFCKNATFVQMIKALDEGANPNARNNTHNKTTALMTAAHFNHDVKAIEALIDAGAELEARNHKGNTPLHFAALENIPEVVKLLVKKGADIEALNHEKKKPLDYARNNKNLNNTDVIKLLTPKSESETQAEIQESETQSSGQAKLSSDKQKDLDAKLLKISEKGSPKEISNLIEQGANVDAQTANRTTPLMIAAQYNSFEAVKTLIEHNANVNARNKTGSTALHLAAQFNTLETVRLLIENHAEINVQNKTKNTPLHLAAEFNIPEVVMELLKAGADVNITNAKNKTPLDIAKANTRLKDSEVINKMSNKPDFKKDFLRICRSGSHEDIAEALKAGANVNSKSKALRSALMFAARYNTAEAVCVLIDAGAHINSQDIYGNTALIYAASDNDEAVVETLVEAGADVEIASISGAVAYDYARKNYRLADSEVLNKLKIS